MTDHPLPELADHLSATEINEILDGTVVGMHDDESLMEVPLTDLMEDLSVGHEELDKYKEGGLRASSAIDERIIEAEQRNDDDLVLILEAIKKKAFGLYLRLQRGDEELTGERDGEFSGFFSEGER
jgi:hypothetical protein